MTKKTITLGELADKLGGELEGDGSVTVSNIRDTGEASKGDLVFVLKKKYRALLENTKATCAVVPQDIIKSPIPVIRCKNPNLAFKKAVEIMLKKETHPLAGIHKTVCIGENVTLGANVTIGAYVVIGDGSVIGKDSIIYPNVTVRDNVKIGNRVIIHSGSVIGSDGFGYERTQAGHEKIPHIGDVVLEDDVEIGSCVCIDRAKIAHTRIGRGTKIDNLVQIGHNVTVGENCIIVSQVGISGSVKIGNNVMIGGQAGIADHLEIGDNVMIAAKAGLMKSVPPNSVMWGIPGRPPRKALTIHALQERLPEFYARLKKLEQNTEKKD